MASVGIRRPRLERQMAVDNIEDSSMMMMSGQRSSNQSNQSLQQNFQPPQHHHAPQRQDTVIRLDSIVLQPK